MRTNGQPIPISMTGVQLLTKTFCTKHIPLHVKSKEGKRFYVNFDADIAHKMFGYRAKFDRNVMDFDNKDPNDCQKNKPIMKYVSEMVSELVSGYMQMPNFSTRQRVSLKKIGASDLASEISSDDLSSCETEETRETRKKK